MPAHDSTLDSRNAGKWWVAVAILTGQLTTSFGMFAVVVALPKIMTAFGADVNAIQWVMTGYMIARAVPMPALGWMAGLLGNRNLYVIGVCGATLCTGLCGLAWNVESLVFFRVLQGVLGAPAMGIGMVILYETFPSRQRGMAMGLILLVGSLGPTIGPSLGGYLVQEISWRAIFFLGIPSGVASIFLTLAVVPKGDLPAQKTIDVPGLFTMTVFLVALLLALSQGQREGWDSGYILSLFAIAVVFFGLFVVIELVVPQPVIYLRLYRNFSFVMASIVVFLYNAGFVGTNFLIALMLQVVFDFTPLQAGLILAPGAIVMGWMGLLSGKLSDRFDPRIPIVCGLIFFALDMYILSTLTLLATVGLVTLLVVIQRGSFGLIQSPISNAVMRTLPDDDRSMGSGLHGLHRGVASSFGVALCSMILEKRVAVHSVLLSQYHDRFSIVVQQALEAYESLLLRAGEIGNMLSFKSQAALGRLLAEHVRMAAYRDCFLLLSVVFIAALIPVWLIRTHAPRVAQTPSLPAAEPATPEAVDTPSGSVSA